MILAEIGCPITHLQKRIGGPWEVPFSTILSLGDPGSLGLDFSRVICLRNESVEQLIAR